MGFVNFDADPTLNYKDEESSKSESALKSAEQTANSNTIFHLIDTIVINSWLMYRRMLIEIDLTDSPMKQMKFRTDLAVIIYQASPKRKKVADQAIQTQ